jgi:putative DNA primase/helicase
MPEQTPLWERAKGRWKEILPTVAGIDVRLLDGKHHPCPLCGGTDRWRYDNREGYGTSICGQCGSRTGLKLVMAVKGWEFREAAIEIEKIIGTGPPTEEAEPAAAIDDAAKYREALALWRQGSRIAPGDPVDKYLIGRLGKYESTRALRIIPETHFSGRKMPAMISAYVDQHGDLAGIQRTFLTADGRKYPDLEADRWNTGKLPDGGAVRLAKHDNVLGIAEGVETALSATVLYGVPVWAALNANRLRVWQPPQGVSNVVIFGDADRNNVGQAAAFSLGERLEREKITTQVMIPPEPGMDWNDVLKQQRPAA